MTNYYLEVQGKCAIESRNKLKQNKWSLQNTILYSIKDLLLLLTTCIVVSEKNWTHVLAKIYSNPLVFKLRVERFHAIDVRSL